MRIALVKRRCSLRHGGSERYCVNLGRTLRAAGHEVTIIGESIDDELRDEFDFRPVRVNRLSSWTRNRSFAENCGQSAHAGKFDIVYGLGRAFGLDAVRVTERLQSHWVNVYYRNPVNRALQRMNPRHRTLIGLERSIYRSERVRRVVTQSQLDRRLVAEYYGIDESKIRTIYNGVDTTAFHPGYREHAAELRRELKIGAGTPLLVFASMDFEGKGLRSILAALAAAKDREARLLVLGTGPTRKFAAIANDFGVGSRTTFLGRRTDIQRFYAAADLFLLPTVYEPFPNVNLEAMACGCPVLTTSTAGGADIIRPGENGYLVPAVHAVAEMIAALDHHLGLGSTARQAMTDHCWNTARRMTIEENMRQTLELFEEILDEKFRV